ncbi:hypothetical protein TrRE_jg3548 [Triparma retinervis]|uniref:Uncharacterized protein n=1 Tax=Triparma retinervis TaxID=2557542 RepID=A0A9W6ZTK7_9STRA|nr:hypothetical protein TrRE_jg3548 [Triparma retinervis]
MAYPGNNMPRGEGFRASSNSSNPNVSPQLLTRHTSSLLPPERHLQPYVFRSPFQSSLLSQQALRRSRKRDSRGRTESEFEKDVLRAGVGVVKGVVGTAFGVLGTVVEGGATVASKIDKSGGDFTPILPPMTLRAGPVRNIFQNNILTENLAKRFKMLGISTPFELQSKPDGSTEGVRKKFVPLKSGDIVYMTASVSSPPLPSSPLGSSKTIYLSSTGPTNTEFGGIEVAEGCEMDEIYWCLFRVWHSDAYSDWHVDNRRPRACVGEHGNYKGSEYVDSDDEEDVDNAGGQQRDAVGDSREANVDEVDETAVIEKIHGIQGRRVISYESDLVFEHIATGQVLASLNDVNSLIDAEATKVALVDRVIASQGRLKNMSKKQKKQQDTHFSITPRFKSRAGVVYDGDLVRVTTFSTQGRVHVSGPHGVIDPLAAHRVREANVSHYHKVVDSDLNNTSSSSSSKAKKNTTGNGEKNASTKSIASQGESVLTIKRFSQWTIPSSTLNYGDCIRISNPEVDAYLWCSSSTRTNKAPFFRRIRHKSCLYEGDHDVSHVVTGCKSIFVIERINRTLGGPIRWNDTVRFRHLITGKYLVVNNSPIIDPEEDDGGANGRRGPLGLLSPSRRAHKRGPAKAKEFQLALYDFKSSANNTPGDQEELFMGSLFNLNPVSAPSGAEGGGSKSSSTSYSSYVSPQNCFAILSHSFVDTYNSDESSDDEDGGSFSHTGNDIANGTQRCYLHADTSKVRHPKKKRLRDLFEVSSLRGEVWGYEKGEGGNTMENNRPHGDTEATFCDRFFPRDAIKIETIEWTEVQAVMFALNAKSIAETYMMRVYKFANRQREGKDTAFSQEFVTPVLKMLSCVSKFASGESIFPNEMRGDENIDKSMRDLVIIDRKYIANCIIQGTKLIDTLFAMLAAPRHAGLLIDHIQREERLCKIHTEVGRTIAIATEDKRAQIYCSMQAFEEGPKAGLGFIGELVKQMHWNLGASGLLDMIVTNNKVLVRELVDERLIEFFLKSLCKRGPSRETLDFLTSINICTTSSKATEPVVNCQETLCKLLFPTFGYHMSSDLGERRFNRRNILLETALATIEEEHTEQRKKRGSSVTGAWSPHRNKRLSHHPQANGYQIVVSWEGLDDYVVGSEETKTKRALFYSARKLGMKYISETGEDKNWHIEPHSWKEYQRTFFHHEELPPRQWVKLSEFIWTIDPIAKHGVENWVKISARLAQDEVAMQRFQRAQTLANYYMGSLNLFTNMCKHRSVRVIKHLEKQFSFECLMAGLADKNLPDLTRSAITDLLLVLYIDRYPHETILLPRVVRPYFSSGHLPENETSLTQCDEMLPRFNTEEFSSFGQATPMMEPQSFEENEEEVAVSAIPLSVEEEESLRRMRSSANKGKFPGFSITKTTIMQDVSNEKFEALQSVIIRVLKSCEMEDQLPASKSHAEAKQVADRMKFTLSVLSVAKKLLFSGFLTKTSQIDELSSVIVRFMRKPDAVLMADGGNGGTISEIENLLEGVGKGLNLVGNTTLDGLGKVGKLFKMSADDEGPSQGNGEANGNLISSSPKYDKQGKRISGTSQGDEVEMVENPTSRSHGLGGLRKHLSFRKPGSTSKNHHHHEHGRKRMTLIGQNAIESASKGKAQKLLDGLGTEEGKQKVVDKLGNDLFKFLDSCDNQAGRRIEVVDVIYERQRQNVLGKWSANHILRKEAKKMEAPPHMEILYFKTGDKINQAAKAWASEDKAQHPHRKIGGLTPLLCSKTNPEVDTVPEPKSLWHYKEDTWMLGDEVDGVVSEDGHKWCYNLNWPGDSGDIFGRTKWWPKYHATAFVRIRKWVRTRQLTTAVGLAVKFAFKLDKVAISNAFRKSAMGNTKDKGKVDVFKAAELMEKALQEKVHESQGNTHHGSNEPGLQHGGASSAEGGGKEGFVNSVHGEVERAKLDTVKCRQLTCDMLTYAAGTALDVRITAVAARLRNALENNTELYFDQKSKTRVGSAATNESSRARASPSQSRRSSFLEQSSSSLKKASTQATANVNIIGAKRVDVSIAGTTKSRDAIVHSMLLKHKWGKNKEPITLTMAGMDLFDSMFTRGRGENHISRLDIGDPHDTDTARNLLSALLTERDGDLAEKILCTLFLHHSRKSLLVHRLSEMHWLMDEESKNLHNKILQNVAVLRNNVQGFFSWASSTIDDSLHDEEDSATNRGDEDRRTSTDGNAFSMQSQRTLEETLLIIKEFTDACYKSNEALRRKSTTNMKMIHKEANDFHKHRTDAHMAQTNSNLKPAKGRQTMMRKLEVHMIFIELLEVEAEIGEQHDQQEEILKLLHTAANDFMVAFMDGNTDNKLEIIRCGAIGIFLKQVGRARGVSRVLASIYKNSAGLVRDVPKSILIDFASHIQEWGVHLKNLFFYMDFFRNVMVVKGVPMRRNQGMVMNVFTDPNLSNTLVTYCSTGIGSEDSSGGGGSASGGGRMRSGSSNMGPNNNIFVSGPAMKRKHLLREFAERGDEDSNNDQQKTFEHILLSETISKDSSSRMTDTERQIYWHARVVELLGLCCTGNVDSTELSASRVINFNEVYSFFSDSEYWQEAPFLWTAFAKFTGNVYFDTDMSSELSSEGRMKDMTTAWEVVLMISEAIEAYVEELVQLVEAEDDQLSKGNEGTDSAGDAKAKKMKKNRKVRATRENVLIEAIIEGGFSAVEAFYRCVVQNYSVLENSGGSSLETSVQGYGYSREKYAGQATAALQGALGLMVDKSIAKRLDDSQRKVLSSSCLVLGIYSDVNLDAPTIDTDSARESELSQAVYDSQRSISKTLSFFSSGASPTADARPSSTIRASPTGDQDDNWERKAARKLKREYAWAIQSSEYVNSQMVDEFNDLVKLVLKFGTKQGKGGGTSEGSSSKKKVKKKKKGKKAKAIKIDDVNFETNKNFDALIQRLIEHVRRLVAGLVEGLDKYNMTSGEANAGLMTNCLLGFRSSAPLVLRLLRNCITQAEVMWDDEHLFIDAERKQIIKEKKKAKMQEVMVKCGAADLVVDLLAGLGDSGGDASSQEGGDENVRTGVIGSSLALTEYVKEEALKFAIELLDGGNKEVQDKIFTYLSNNTNAASKFFGGIHSRIEKANRCTVAIRRWIEYRLQDSADMSSVEQEGINELYSVKGDLKVGLIFKMLQLLNEGHNLQMQRLLEDQSVIGLNKNRGLVRAGASLITNSAFSKEAVERMEPESLDELTQLFDFLTECVQGPSLSNQRLLSMTQVAEAASFIFQCKIGEKDILNGAFTSVAGDITSSKGPASSDDAALTANKSKMLEVQRRSNCMRKLSLAAAKTMNSMLEGRAESESCPVHNYLCQKLNPKLLINRLTVAYHTFKLCKKKLRSSQYLIPIPLLKYIFGAIYSLSHDKMIADRKSFLMSQKEKAFDIGIEITTLLIRLSHVDAKFDPHVSMEMIEIEDNITHRGFWGKLNSFLMGDQDEDDDEEEENANYEVEDLKKTLMEKAERKALEKHRHTQKKALHFFQSKLRAIEVVWGSGGLSTVYFPIPPEGAFMSDEIKENMFVNIDYGSEDRVKELMKLVPEVQDELKWHETLERLHIPQKQSTTLLNQFTFVVSLVINFIMIVSLQYDGAEESPTYKHEELYHYIEILGIANCVLAAVKCLHIGLFKLPIILKKMSRFRLRARYFNTISSAEKEAALLSAFKTPLGILSIILIFSHIGAVAYGDIYSRGHPGFWVRGACYVLLGLSTLRSIHKVAQATGYPTAFLFWYSFVWQSVEILKFYGFMLASSILGTIYSREYPLFYSLQLFTIIPMSPTLTSVMRAVTDPGNQLVMSAVLGLIIIYTFSLIAFFFFHSSGAMMNNDQGVNECHDMISCLKSFVRNGLLYGGGIGDFINGDLGNSPDLDDDLGYWSRLMFDLSFFIIVIVLLLNIIFGIILDTFSSLREAQNTKIELKSSQCFICGLGRDLFEDQKQLGGKGFAFHQTNEHSVYDYVYFTIYLRSKHDTEFNGAETFVQECLDKDDISWIPDGIALQIPRIDVYAEREKRMDEMFKGLRERSDGVQEVLSGEIGKVSLMIERQFGMFRKQIAGLKEEVKVVKQQNAELQAAKK